MNRTSPYIIQKYKLLYQENPHSKIFAPLAEAYRKTGYQEKAIEICKEGLKLHPYFAEGYVALAKIYFDQENYKEATKYFQRAVELSPENLLAHKYLAQSYLKLKNPKKALRAYKMLLFLNPYDSKAQQAVKKLESLTADEYKDESLFTLESLMGQSKENPLELEKMPSSEVSRSFQELDRFLSLADAFIVRGDTERAKDVLKEAERALGPYGEIEDRLNLIQNNEKGALDENENDQDSFQESVESAIDEFLSPLASERNRFLSTKKIAYMKTLLNRIQERKRIKHELLKREFQGKKEED